MLKCRSCEEAKPIPASPLNWCEVKKKNVWPDDDKCDCYRRRLTGAKKTYSTEVLCTKRCQHTCRHWVWASLKEPDEDVILKAKVDGPFCSEAEYEVRRPK